MAKSAIHKLLREILHGIEKLIYIRFIDKHILLNSFPQQCILCQTLRFLKGNQDTSRAPNNNKQPSSCQTSLRNSLFQLVQRISLRFKSPDLYLFCTAKVFPRFLLPFESQASFQSEELGSYDYMHHGRFHWSRVLYQVLVHMLMQKRPLLHWARVRYVNFDQKTIGDRATVRKFSTGRSWFSSLNSSNVRCHSCCHIVRPAACIGSWLYWTYLLGLIK